MIVALLNQKGGVGKTTLEQRGRIKVTAFQRGQTVADMLRELLAREFPDKDRDPQ